MKTTHENKNLELLAASLELMVNRAYDLDATVRHDEEREIFIVNDRRGEHVVNIACDSPLAAAKDFCRQYFMKVGG